jgi:hypothetical protein
MMENAGVSYLTVLQQSYFEILQTKTSCIFHTVKNLSFSNIEI